jgi:signal transduction histidine kinase
VADTILIGNDKFRLRLNPATGRLYRAGSRYSSPTAGMAIDRHFKAVGQNGAAGGTGLAISSEFIQRMRGDIGLDTSVTDGAAFYFRLPVSQNG